MAKVTACLEFYIVERLSTDPLWKGLKVVLSDGSVPGEGEHKIMEFIRRSRLDPNYDPNTRHVIYGLDADLIMLSLATHEPHFSILREQVFPTGPVNRNCFRCGQPGHRASECTAILPKEGEEDSLLGKGPKQSTRKPYQLLHLAILREYLEAEFQELKGVSELERIIDDFVFLCFFVGNDFLPPLPSLDIREGAIDALITLYKKLMPKLGGYLTTNGEVDLAKVTHFVRELGDLEDEVFKRRRIEELRRRQRDRQSRRDERRPAQWIEERIQEEEEEISKLNRSLKVPYMTRPPRPPMGYHQGTPMQRIPPPPPSPNAPMLPARRGREDAQPLGSPAAPHDVSRSVKPRVDPEASPAPAPSPSTSNKSAAALLREALMKEMADSGASASASTTDTVAPRHPSPPRSPNLLLLPLPKVPPAPHSCCRRGAGRPRPGKRRCPDGRRADCPRGDVGPCPGPGH
eukprot:GAFH01001192.1.p1 GENE.GAFH01001192.1~~GAFH01001192.1.p1  ORF type:complete len:461 (-),score=140.52 GAFH01001192.1:91-1473(-)